MKTTYSNEEKIKYFKEELEVLAVELAATEDLYKAAFKSGRMIYILTKLRRLIYIKLNEE